jgi:hypothetical protein
MDSSWEALLMCTAKQCSSLTYLFTVVTSPHRPKQIQALESASHSQQGCLMNMIKTIFPIKVFATLLRLLKYSSGYHLRWLACLKGPCFLYNSLACHSACPNPSPKPVSLSGKTVNLWPGQIPGEGQIHLRHGCKESLSAILCLCISLAGVSTCLHPLDQEKIALSRFSVSRVSVLGTGGLLLTTIWGFIQDSTFHLRRGPQPFPGEWSPAAWLQQLWGLAEDDNFPDLQMNLVCRISWQCSEDRNLGDHLSFVHKPRQETSRGWPSNILVVGILGLCDVWIRCVGWHTGKVKSWSIVLRWPHTV